MFLIRIIFGFFKLTAKMFAIGFVLFVLVSITQKCNAQIRHVKGIKAVDLTYGYSPVTRNYTASYVAYLSNDVYLKSGLFYLQGQDKGLNFISVGLEVAYNYNLFTINEFIFFNGRGGLAFSNDRFSPALVQFDGAGNISESAHSAFKVGVLLGIETEIFITDKFVLLLGGDQRLMFGDKWGSNRFFLFSGIRFNL